MKSEVVLVEEYPHPPERVWRALTDPAELSQWLMKTDFEPVVGKKFKFVHKPQPGWRGFVECEVLECERPLRLVYRWVGNAGQNPTTVTWSLEPTATGTRLSFSHRGFEGIGGFFLAKLMLGPGWKKMLTKKIPLVLAGSTDPSLACAQ
jgi:uncharacterized protein YndB with AHSA1/START domain